MVEIEFWCIDNDHAVIYGLSAVNPTLADWVTDISEEAGEKIFEWIRKEDKAEYHYHIPISEIRELVGATNLEINIEGPKEGEPIFPERV